MIESEDFRMFVAATYRVNREGNYKNGKGVTVTPQIMFEEYSFWAFKNGKSMDGITLETVTETLAAWQQQMQASKKKSKDDTPRTDYIIQQYLNEHGNEWRISSTMAMVERCTGPGTPTKTADIGELATAVTVWAQNENGWKVTRETVRMNLVEWMSQLKTRIIYQLFTQIGYQKEYEAETDRLLAGIHELFQIKQDVKIFITIMRHWLWQVKRKLLGLDTIWDLWVNFYGGAGIGKSTLLRTMCTLLTEFYDEPNLSIFADTTRERDKFTCMYILNFDELTMGERISYYDDGSIPPDVIKGMKKMITQKDGTFRTMGGQEQAKRRITFSGISSANDHLYDIVFDETTMRRYFEFECGMTKDQLNDEYYAKKDALQATLASIWRGVDEGKKDGYLNPGCAVWEQVQAIQESYYPTRTTTLLWIEDQNVVAGGKSNSMEIYQEYVDWCKDRGYSNRNEGNWRRDIQHILPGAKEYRRNINISYGEPPCE